MGSRHPKPLLSVVTCPRCGDGFGCIMGLDAFDIRVEQQVCVQHSGATLLVLAHKAGLWLPSCPFQVFKRGGRLLSVLLTSFAFLHFPTPAGLPGGRIREFQS